MFYEGAIFRPPSEAGSLILQVTVGCKHNACTFCGMYKAKKFRVKPESEIKQIIAQAKASYPGAERIFLADGNALALETPLLEQILSELYEAFPRLARVGIYAGPRDILAKSPEELESLHRKGLSILYMGIESGSGKILQAVKKGVTPEEMILAGRKAMTSGTKLSCTIIIGLGGCRDSRDHALETAKVINAINPHYLAALTLMADPSAPLYRAIERGEFGTLTPLESLVEIHTLIEGLTVDNCVFRCNHASNYLPLKANLPRDKADLLATIQNIVTHNRIELLKPEGWRGL